VHGHSSSRGRESAEIAAVGPFELKFTIKKKIVIIRPFLLTLVPVRNGFVHNNSTFAVLIKYTRNKIKIK